MTTKKSKGKAVRDVKGPTEKQPLPKTNQVQIHAGNIQPLTVQLLGEISQKLGRIADAMEKVNG
jgi:hypothetical protein